MASDQRRRSSCRQSAARHLPGSLGVSGRPLPVSAAQAGPPSSPADHLRAPLLAVTESAQRSELTFARVDGAAPPPCTLSAPILPHDDELREDSQARMQAQGRSPKGQGAPLIITALSSAPPTLTSPTIPPAVSRPNNRRHLVRRRRSTRCLQSPLSPLPRTERHRECPLRPCLHHTQYPPPPRSCSKPSSSSTP